MASRVEIPAAAAPGPITATLDLTPADAKLARAADAIRALHAGAWPAAALAAPALAPPPPAPAAPPPPAPAAAYSAPAYAEYTNDATPASAAEPSMGAWDLVWAIDPEDRARDAVTAAAWAPALPGLPGGDGHAGWLVTGSCGLV
jgi:hypothetical protein